MTDINQTNEPNPDQAPSEGYTPPVGKHKFLLTLVIGMGLLFFVGMAALIYAVINKVEEPTAIVAENVGNKPARPTTMDATSFGSMDIQKPADSTLVDYTSDGTYLTLRFKSADGAEELIIIRLSSGQETGRLKLIDQ